LVLPESSVLEKFDETVTKLRKAIHGNVLAGKSLSVLRNTLLDELPSGELKPASIKKQAIE